MALRARPDNLALDHPLPVDASPRPDFDELWAHRDAVHAASRRLVGDDSAADDVVQDTFVRALRARSLDRRGSFAPWLATVARRRSIDQLRAESRVFPVATLPDQPAGAADDPLEQVLHQERAARVRAALATLAPRERQLLLRQAAHGLSLAELAAEEATSVASVRSVLARARTKLRSSLARGGALGAAPLPRLVAGGRRMLHRWAQRLESGVPALAGAGAQFGDVVGAAIAAVALLLAGTMPAHHDRTPVALAAAERQAEARSPAPPPPPSERPGPGDKPGRAGPPARPGAGSHGAPPPGGGGSGPLAVQPPSVELPGLPADGAYQPEEVHVQRIAASDDGATLVISGIKDSQASNGGEGLYRSDDGGHTWRWLEAGGYAYGYVVVPPGFDAHGTLFAVSNPLLLRSDNGGRSFTPVGYSRNGVTALPTDPSDRRIFLTPAGLGAYDAGTGRTTPYPAMPSGVNSLAVTSSGAAGPSFVIGTSERSGLTTQGAVQRCTVDACSAPVALPGLTAAPRVFASRSVPGLILATGFGRLYRSADGGATFTQVAFPPVHTIHTIVDGAPGELLLARSNPGNASSSGLLRSVDGGLTWTPLGLGTPLQQGVEGLAYLSTGRIVAGIDNRPGIRCSVDGGLTWAARCPL